MQRDQYFFYFDILTIQSPSANTSIVLCLSLQGMKIKTTHQLFSMREHFSLAFQDSCHFHLCYKCEIISLSCLPFLMHLQRQLRYLFLLLHQNYFTNAQNPYYCFVFCCSFPIANENFFFTYLLSNRF